MQIQINGHDVFYTTHGEGRPMLLMHGGPGLDHTHFRPWLDPLGEHIQLIYYDFFGNGRTSRPQSFEGLTIEPWLEEADGLRAALGLDKIILFGFSYGGFVAQDYALRYGEHLAGLILCDTAPSLDYTDVLIASAQAHGTPEQVQVALGGPSDPATFSDADFQQTWNTILSMYFHTYDPQIGKAMDKQTQYSGGAYLHAATSYFPTFNTVSRLGEITTPALILAGRHDWITPPAQGAERLHAGLPNSEMVIFEESGHFPFIEEREKFLTTVGKWIASLG